MHGERWREEPIGAAGGKERQRGERIAGQGTTVRAEGEVRGDGWRGRRAGRQAG